MKSLFTTTALGAVLALTPALAQDPPQQQEAPQQQQQEMPQQQDSPEMQQPGEAQAPDAAEPGERADPADAAEAEPEAAEGPAELEFVNQQDENDFLSSDLVGQSVLNSEEESIGQINSLAFDDQGQLTTAVIGVGGFLGLGQKEVGVNFDALEITRDMDDEIQVVIDTSREDLEGAPEYQTLADVRSDEEAPAPQQESAPGGAPAPGTQ